MQVWRGLSFFQGDVQVKGGSTGVVNLTKFNTSSPEVQIVRQNAGVANQRALSVGRTMTLLISTTLSGLLTYVGTAAFELSLVRLLMSRSRWKLTTQRY